MQSKCPLTILFYFPCRVQWFGVYTPDSRSGTLKVETHRARQRMGPEESLQAEVGASEPFLAEDCPNLRRNNKSDGEWRCRDENPSVLLTGKTHSLLSLSRSHPMTHEQAQCHPEDETKWSCVLWCRVNSQPGELTKCAPDGGSGANGFEVLLCIGHWIII